MLKRTNPNPETKAYVMALELGFYAKNKEPSMSYLDLEQPGNLAVCAHFPLQNSNLG